MIQKLSIILKIILDYNFIHAVVVAVCNMPIVLLVADLVQVEGLHQNYISIGLDSKNYFGGYTQNDETEFIRMV